MPNTIRDIEHGINLSTGGAEKMGFRVICEIEPPRSPDLRHVRHQIGVLAPVVDSFLIPDNHLGRATVSSIAVAHEVAEMGGRVIACLNSRDRNVLGMQRDLLTAAAYGVSQFLFVHGDELPYGSRTSELTVRAMLDQARLACNDPTFSGVMFEIGVTARVGHPVPAWKRQADFMLLQISYSVGALLRWRDRNPSLRSVYPGVVVLSSEQMAKRLRSAIPGIDIPDKLVRAVARDPRAGVDAAWEQVQLLSDTDAFDGVHLVPARRFREIATCLEEKVGASSTW